MGNSRNELKDIRQFGATVAVILIIFGTVHFLKHRVVMSQWFFGIGIMVLFIGIVIPKILKPGYAVFLKAAHAIGWFNTRVILILVYFMVVFPIAIIMKILGKDLLDRKIDKTALTYWVKRAASKATKEQLEKQF